MKNVCSAVLMGGIGNLMFQISCCLAYSNRYGKIPRFYKKMYGEANHTNIYDYSSNIFKNLNLIDDFDVEDAEFYNEPEHHYIDIPDRKEGRSVILNGYFQSEKYFSDYKEGIRAFFDFGPSEKSKSETCSIHIRRGDYLALSQFHPQQSINYFKSAINTIGKDKKFIVFSDDIQWCKENLGILDCDIEYFHGKNAYDDLLAMSSCSHNIIANSTFSWWAAWLNKNPDKKIIAPKLWFGPAYTHKSTEDVYCDGWITI